MEALSQTSADTEDLLALGSPGGQNRRLTMLFIDVVDSTALSCRVEPETYWTVVGSYRRLVLNAAHELGGYIGFMGEPFAVRDPTALILQAHLPPGGDVDKVLRSVEEECARIAIDGLGPDELSRTQARMATHLLRDTDAVLGRALQTALLEQQRGEPELLNRLHTLIGEVTEEQIVTAAGQLVPSRRAAVEVIPGGAK